MNNKSNKSDNNRCRDWVNNKGLLAYNAELKKQKGLFENAKNIKIKEIEKNKIGIIEYIPLLMENKIKSFLGKSSALMFALLFQFFTIYYPFVVMSKYLFNWDVHGLGAYILILIGNLVLMGWLSKKIKVVDKEKIKRVKKECFEKSIFFINKDVFLKSNFVSEDVDQYLKMNLNLHKYQFIFKKYNCNDKLKINYYDLIEEISLF